MDSDDSGIFIDAASHPGQLVQYVHAAYVKEDGTEVTSLDPSEFVCSYSFQRDEPHRMYIPGVPPSWNPVSSPTLPCKVVGEWGLYGDTARNVARFSDRPWEPMFKAIHLTCPGINFENTQVISTSRSLCKLFNFVKWDNNHLRVEFEMVQDTLFLVHVESEEWNGVRDGYNVDFLSRFTKEPQGLRAHGGHQRATRYTLGDLECTILGEVDAYDPGIPSTNHLAFGPASDPASRSKPQEVNQNPSSKALSPGLCIARSSPPWMVAEDSYFVSRGLARKDSISLMSGGRVIPSHQVVRTKCKLGCHDKEFISHADMIRLWSERIPNLYIGIYQEGILARVREQHVSALRSSTWEKENQGPLRKVVTILKEFRRIAKASSKGSRGRFVVVEGARAKRSVLEVWKVPASHEVLPQEWIKRFWRKHSKPLRDTGFGIPVCFGLPRMLSVLSVERGEWR